MSDKPVFLIGFQEQDNLGIGYLSSILVEHGFSVKILDVGLGKYKILENILLHEPLVVGVSIIFQYHIRKFKELVAYLKKEQPQCHFTAGGHYPSIRSKEILDFVPQLDSVVLYEGEHTFLELVQKIYAGNSWQTTKGIAYRDNGKHCANALRPLQKDLDKFPIPVRPQLKTYALGKKYATILAGRGCIHNCTFCSIREFYSKPPGKIKRLRKPEYVIKEMELLINKMNCSIFMFQDDDFPVGGEQGKEWVTKFCRLLSKHNIKNKILWKINCRTDEIDKDLFSLMKHHGLFLVYLGIESGTDDGLQRMNKKISADVNYKSINTLKSVGIEYDFGFMLFEPWSTYNSISDNLQFLENICSDGSSPITFCKMLPYAGTKIEKLLAAGGRLKGEQGFKDYDFKIDSLNHYYKWMFESFNAWISNHEGLLNTIRWARYYSAVYKKYFSRNKEFESLQKTIKEITAKSNLKFIKFARKALKFFEESSHNQNTMDLDIMRKEINTMHNQYKVQTR